MTISIELAPDEEQKLEEKARSERPVAVSDYVRELIRKELNGGTSAQPAKGKNL